MKDKVCPMLIMTGTNNYYCREENCAWWSFAHGEGWGYSISLLPTIIGEIGRKML